MVVWAVWFGASLTVLAFFNLKEVWMIFLFLPAMRILALVLIRASFCIWCYEIISLPIWAHFTWISEDWWLPSVVLPVVGIYAHLTIVVVFTVRAPDRLEMEHIEVHVYIIILNELYWQLISIVCEGTKFLVITFWVLMGLKIRRTKFGFVFIRMVKFLDSVVSSVTGVTIRAREVAVIVLPMAIATTVLRMLATSMLICIDNMRTDFWLVSTQRSSPVFIIVMVVGTALQIMILRVLGAGVDLECV